MPRLRAVLQTLVAGAVTFATLLLLAAALHAETPGETPASETLWETLLHRGRLGLHVQPLTPELRRHLGAPEDRGVLVGRVEEERPAARAGIDVGDVVIRAGDTAVASASDLLRAVATVPEGQPLALEIVRAGETRTLQVTPDGPAVPDADRLGEWLERSMREGSRELREQLEKLEEQLEEFERRLREPPSEAPRRT